ncbi:RabGAP/TBC [Calocera viscosa TUFC12733]|uniref:RabGAP/TBC n=1 Tax=Calocera viscosa (strain TUFC12733) TaxID=1330018 RepID=A0A167IFG1_CALVF|nr:RabGAP/TBC [Calocera viscosa TUFC12733]
MPPTPVTPYTPPTFGPRTQDQTGTYTISSRDSLTANGNSLTANGNSLTANGNTATISGSDLHRSMSSRTSRRRERLVRCLAKDDIDMAELTQISWQGIPADLRPIVWQLLLTYLPLPSAQRLNKLHVKRQEYASLSSLTFSKPLEQTIWHQIAIDVPRTRPGVPLWADPATQKCLERILYLWAVRHPASGYVQGINDLVTPFFQVFLSFYIDGDPSIFSPSNLPQSALTAVEADSFWCLSNLLDGIQMNYIHGQPGIVNALSKMSELVGRIDYKLSQHLEKEGVEYMQFAFRWMNCLLMRELSVENTIRMWDTYMCEGSQAFSQFHLFVCTAFLLTWSKQLLEMDFQGMIMFLQSLPTQDWSDRNIEELMGKAWQLSNTWKDAQGHLGTPR